MQGLAAICIILSTLIDPYPIRIELHAIKEWPWQGSYTIINNDEERDKLCSLEIIDYLTELESQRAREGL